MKDTALSVTSSSKQKNPVKIYKTSKAEIIQHSLPKYAAEGTLKTLIGLGMKIHIPQTPMDTILKHSHPILTPVI